MEYILLILVCLELSLKHMPFPPKMLQVLGHLLVEIGTCIVEEKLVCAFPLQCIFLYSIYC